MSTILTPTRDIRVTEGNPFWTIRGYTFKKLDLSEQSSLEEISLIPNWG